MAHIHDILRERLLRPVKAVEINYEKKSPEFTLKELQKTQWSSKFEKLMRNRLIMGALRYGRNFGDSKDKSKYDRVGSIQKRILEWQETGNDELLVDVANLCMLEFEEGIHPKKHFKSVDDGEHVGTKFWTKPRLNEVRDRIAHSIANPTKAKRRLVVIDKPLTVKEIKEAVEAQGTELFPNKDFKKRTIKLNEK